jgi:hypothetical protein
MSSDTDWSVETDSPALLLDHVDVVDISGWDVPEEQETELAVVPHVANAGADIDTEAVHDLACRGMGPSGRRKRGRPKGQRQ